jgi:hypothetical protein
MQYGIRRLCELMAKVGYRRDDPNLAGALTTLEQEVTGGGQRSCIRFGGGCKGGATLRTFRHIAVKDGVNFGNLRIRLDMRSCRGQIAVYDCGDYIGNDEAIRSLKMLCSASRVSYQRITPAGSTLMDNGSPYYPDWTKPLGKSAGCLRGASSLAQWETDRIHYVGDINTTAHFYVM